MTAQSIHGEVSALRQETREGFAAVNGRIDGLAGEMAVVKSDVAEIKGLLAQVLERLPEQG
jgi:hypothetical protein